MFTFKTEKPEGKYKGFSNPSHNIKILKTIVGEIIHKEWKIRLMVIKDGIEFKDENTNCKWITLKRESESLQDAKDFLNRNFVKITERYPLYKKEEYK